MYEACERHWLNNGKQVNCERNIIMGNNLGLQNNQQIIKKLER